MRVITTELPGVTIIEPQVFTDVRGYFFETWRQERYRENGVINDSFVQDNLSFSTKGVLRGLHYQYPYSQGKLVSVISGEVFDVAVDIRIGSPTFRMWIGVSLSGGNYRQLWIPPGFAHGFCVISESAYLLYKCTDVYTPEAEGGIIWNDPDIAIKWPIDCVRLSEKDNNHPLLRDIPLTRLPAMENKNTVGEKGPV